MKKIWFVLITISFCQVSTAQNIKNSTDYIYASSTSLKAKLAISYLNLRSKKGIEKAFKQNTFDSTAAKIPKKYFKEFSITTAQVLGKNVYTLSPRINKSGKYILYIHGGAYIANMVKNHWNLIGELIRKTNATVIVPDYPLAPAHTVQEAFPMVEQIYKDLLSRENNENLILMGDSAGGGFALSLAQKTKKDAGQQPGKIILLSPWLDITTSNPDMVPVEKKDPMLQIHGLQLAGKAYAGKLDTMNYLVSPLYGDMSGLAKISLFIGGRDIFIADARKFKNMMQQKKIPMNYFEYPGMFHVWVAATFIKESKVAMRQIAGLINNNP